MRISAGRLLPALAIIGLLAASCTHSSPSTKGTPTASTSTASAAASPAASPSLPASATLPAPAAPKLIWTSCGAPFQCAKIAVPLDWSQPGNGQTVTLALIRLPAAGSPSERIGSLFVNPGGPGASVVDFVRSIQQVLPSEILARFDIVGFDPRGIGGSQPLSCLPGPQMDAYLALDPAPSTPAEIARVQAADQQFAAGCAADYGPAFLENIGTLSAARDMDYIRQAVGDAKLTYIGYSYGTFLGAQYANLFPTHVRALVLDGAVDPALPELTFDQQQAVGFDQELGDFLSNCTGNCAFASGGNPRGAFTTLEAKITATPIPVGRRQLTQALFLDGVADGLYTPATWPQLAGALQAAVGGDGSQLLSMADDLTDRNSNGSYDALTSAGTAVNCVDSTYPKDAATYQADAAQAAQQAPVFGAPIVWGSFVCANWPVAPTITPGPVSAPGAPPILVVGTTGDPATPYGQAVSLAHELSSGVLLTHNGLGHTSLGQGSGCVQQVETTYVITLHLPASGSVCGNGNGSPSPPPAAGG
jgi:pimeloyl-ACP methyl ester carboxylesterase